MKLNYRPEVDGLRAIAVFTVIFYHAEIVLFDDYLFKGGFIGVDIFFVISGYLITSLILKELKETGHFSFKNFYERRIRRILPVLVLIMSVSLPFAWICLLPTSFVDYGKSLISSIFFSSNFYFLFTGQDYDGTFSLLKPFLHIWSLSVEEQYYILYPIILFSCFKFFRKYLLIILIFVLLISLILADWSSRHDPSLTFYSLHTRGWELLAGALLATIEIDYGRSSNKFLSNSLPFVGLLLILHAVFFFSEKIIFHPSFYTLSPIIGVMFIIHFSKKGELITNILSTKILVGSGLISYSLYLWHFPIFAFGRVTEFFGDGVSKKLIILTILLSLLSYFFVERPFRNRQLISRKYLAVFISFFVSIILISSFFIIKNKGYPSRLEIFTNLKNFQINNEALEKDWLKFKQKIESPLFEQSSKKKKILIIGNSHARDLFNGLYLNKDLSIKYDFSIIQTEVRCLKNVLKKLNCDGKSKSTDPLRNIHLHNFNLANILLISTRWLETDIELLDEVNSIAKYNNKKLVITSNTPEFNYKKSSEFADRTVIKDSILTDLFYKKSTLIDLIVLKNSRIPSNEEKLEIEKKYYKFIPEALLDLNKKIEKKSQDLDIVFLDKIDYVCNKMEERCEVLMPDNSKIYYDYGHYTVGASKYFGKKIHKVNWLKLD